MLLIVTSLVMFVILKPGIVLLGFNPTGLVAATFHLLPGAIWAVVFVWSAVKHGPVALWLLLAAPFLVMEWLILILSLFCTGRGCFP
ncbi:hypothetical protein AYO42_01595 [Rhizomicrobium sp. SCGC AG-212-E05]|nr:hypothetical protein AYO42_01595 [Rhizomicrobium sp. SCGC AG-212-E05]